MTAMAGESALTAETLRRAFDSAFASPFPERREDLDAFLTLRVSSTAYTMRVLEIAGLAPARSIVPLPSALPALLGLTAVRGSVYPVYCLEALLGGEPANESPGWFVLCEGTHPVALAFAQLEGHVVLSRSEFYPANRDEGPRRHVRELVRVADEMRGVIDVASLVEAIHERVSAGMPIKEP
jgi:chemotaxis signal transduction protein